MTIMSTNSVIASIGSKEKTKHKLKGQPEHCVNKNQN